MENVSNDGHQDDLEPSLPALAEISKIRVFVASENIKSFSRQIAAAQDEADRIVLTKMLWAEQENLASAMAALRA